MNSLAQQTTALAATLGLTGPDKFTQIWKLLGDLCFIAIACFLVYKLVAAILALLAYRMRKLTDAVEFNERMEERTISILHLLQSASGYVLFTIALLLVLKRVGVDTKPLITGAAFVGAAIAFGTQNLVRDLVTGLFVFFEGQLVIGDIVQLGSLVGVVENFGLRITEVRTLGGRTHYVRNGDLGGLIRFAKGEQTWFLEVPLASAESSESASGILQKAASELLQEPDVARVSEPACVRSLTDGGCVLRLEVASAPFRVTELQNRFLARSKALLQAAEIQLAPGYDVICDNTLPEAAPEDAA